MVLTKTTKVRYEASRAAKTAHHTTGPLEGHGKDISTEHKSRVRICKPRKSEAISSTAPAPQYPVCPALLILVSLPLDLKQSGPEFAGDMRFQMLLIWLLNPIVNGTSDPLAVIRALLDTIGIQYVPPPARPGTCRDCSRSQLARFGIDLTPTLPTNPCCTTTPAAPATTTTTTSGTTTTTEAGTTTTTTASGTTTTATTTTTTTATTTAPTCTCGQEGTTRIVGGEQSTVRNLFYCSRSFSNIPGRKIPVDHSH